MEIKKPKVNKDLSTLVFVDEETNALVLHIYGFDDKKAAMEFVKYMLNKADINYTPLNDLFELPQSIH